MSCIVCIRGIFRYWSFEITRFTPDTNNCNTVVAVFSVLPSSVQALDILFWEKGKDLRKEIMPKLVASLFYLWHPGSGHILHSHQLCSSPSRNICFSFPSIIRNLHFSALVKYYIYIILYPYQGLYHGSYIDYNIMKKN